MAFREGLREVEGLRRGFVEFFRTEVLVSNDPGRSNVSMRAQIKKLGMLREFLPSGEVEVAQ